MSGILFRVDANTLDGLEKNLSVLREPERNAEVLANMLQTLFYEIRESWKERDTALAQVDALTKERTQPCSSCQTSLRLMDETREEMRRTATHRSVALDERDAARADLTAARKALQTISACDGEKRCPTCVGAALLALASAKAGE